MMFQELTRNHVENEVLALDLGFGLNTWMDKQWTRKLVFPLLFKMQET